MMRAWFLATALLIGAPTTIAVGQHAGITRVRVPADPPFDTLVWYPTEAAEVPWQDNGFLIPATRDAAVAQGHFRVVLLAHGGGLTGGSPLLLRDLSADLAKHGFIVIAPFHGKAGLRARPPQMRMALAAALGEPRIAPHADAVRLGMIGFSLGGAVTLELAGAIPNDAHLREYCTAHPDDAMSCAHAPDGNNIPIPNRAAAGDMPRRPVPLPLKAIVLLDPFAALFAREGLTAVTMPVLLLRPDQSQLPPAGNALALAEALPHPPLLYVVPGQHFTFADVCLPSSRPHEPELCGDPPGVDRASVHADVQARIVAFLRANL